MSVNLLFLCVSLLVSCSYGQWYSQQQPQQPQQPYTLNTYNQINALKPMELASINPAYATTQGNNAPKPDESSLMDPIKSEETVAFNPIKAFEPVTFQQKLIQIRQKIARPPPLQQSLFTHFTDELDEDDDEMENGEISEPPQVQQHRITSHKPNRLLPVVIGMIPTACGSKMYYPKKQFCYHNRPYNRDAFGQCGPRIYKKEGSFCFNGQTYNKLRKGICGNGIYDKLTQICLNHRVKNICAGEIFDPRTHFCYERIYNRVFYSMCGKRVYKKTSHYCLDGRVYPKHERFYSTSIGTAYMPHDLSLWGRSLRKQYLRNKKHHNWKPENDVRGERKNMVPAAKAARYYQQQHSLYQTQVPKVRQMPQKTLNVHHQPQMQLAITHQQVRPYVKQIRGQQQPNVRQLQSLKSHYANQIANYNAQHPQARETMPYQRVNPLHYAAPSSIKPQIRPTQAPDTCGIARFDSKSQFCYEGKINKRCGMMAYNPKALLCYRDFLYTRELYDLCGGNDMFNKYTQSCLNGHVLQREKKPELKSLVIDNTGVQISEQDRKDQEYIQNLSQQLAAKRKEFQERKQREQLEVCAGNKYNKRSQFCHDGKLYSRTIKAVCGGFLYNRNSQRCLGGQLFPHLDLNKPTFYVGGLSGVQGTPNYNQGQNNYDQSIANYNQQGQQYSYSV